MACVRSWVRIPLGPLLDKIVNSISMEIIKRKEPRYIEEKTPVAPKDYFYFGIKLFLIFFSVAIIPPIIAPLIFIDAADVFEKKLLFLLVIFAGFLAFGGVFTRVIIRNFLKKRFLFFAIILNSIVFSFVIILEEFAFSFFELIYKVIATVLCSTILIIFGGEYYSPPLSWFGAFLFAFIFLFIIGLVESNIIKKSSSEKKYSFWRFVVFTIVFNAILYFIISIISGASNT